MNNKLMIDRLHEALNDKGWTITQLQTVTGINKGTLSHYFNGNMIPKYQAVETIANALQVSPCWLVGWSDNKEI